MIDAIRTALAGEPFKVWDGDATPATEYPYVLVLGATPSRGREEDVAACSSQSNVIIRAVGLSAAHARAALLLARARLRGLHAESDGVRWAFKFDSCPRHAQVDRSFIEPVSESHPVFIDDEYTVYGTPVA